MAIPNGMTTAYTYDNRNRLTKIEHKDGATALDSFAYTLNAQGQHHADHAGGTGSYWDYTYDDRYRLATADRYSGGGIHAHYGYTYDAADNMTSKVEPLFDDFDDGDYTGWNVSAGTWSASTGRLRGTADGGSIWRNQTAGNLEADLKYLRETGSTSAYFIVYPRYINGQNYTRVQLQSGQIYVDEYQNATWVTLGSTRSLRNQIKAILGQDRFEPYGCDYSTMGVSITHKFALLERDPVLLCDYAPYRYYQPALARWLTPDPLGMVARTNLFEYAKLSPTRWIDPLGAI